MSSFYNYIMLEDLNLESPEVSRLECDIVTIHTPAHDSFDILYINSFEFFY